MKKDCVETPITPNLLANIIENNQNSAQKNERSLTEVLSEYDGQGVS